MGHGIIAWIIIGLLAGWITGKLMKGSGFRLLHGHDRGPRRRASLGVLSSFLGSEESSQHGLIISIVIAVIGAVLLTWVVRLITGNRAANL